MKNRLVILCSLFILSTAVLIVSFAKSPSLVLAEDILVKLSEDRPVISHLESLENALLAEEKKLMAQMGHQQPYSLNSSNSRYVLSTSYNPTQDIEALRSELEEQNADLKTLEIDFSHLQHRALKVDAGLDFATDEMMFIRTKRVIAGIRTDNLVEKDANYRRDLILQERAEKAKELYSDTSYGVQLPRRDRAIVTGVEIVDRTPGIVRAKFLSEAVPIRSGPGRDFQAVFRGDLNDIVQIEKRYDEWYRVRHSSGARGWVVAQDLLFGERPDELPGVFSYSTGVDLKLDRSDWEPRT